jgi:hypothetical protein
MNAMFSMEFIKLPLHPLYFLKYVLIGNENVRNASQTNAWNGNKIISKKISISINSNEFSFEEWEIEWGSIGSYWLRHETNG